ncbi:tyrosyl-DNA phosphodiesterase 1 [Impatiens glandulifera]|uniref:tyrosyl-DNA phosphodiesterase 1 n=1 Tax=Impatiens glandulifera TaxID=253017 RepID=UPI001FB16164|nr:tyrosyl-DNA phosphodiesterase 1 [Impatiens glandulifera]
MGHGSIGFLIPLDKNLEEDVSARKIALSQGPNFVGRDSIPVLDKRLSRKHILLNSNPDGSLEIVVESSNPIVVRSLDQRRKVLSGEKVKVKGGDIVELIPGHHFLKYVNLSDENKSSPVSNQKRKCNEVTQVDTDHRRAAKGKRIDNSQDEAMARNLKEDIESSSMEAIRGFTIDNDKLPLTFRLLKVQGLPAWANTSCVSITDVIQGDILLAFLSNYMVDIDWLLSACQILKKVPHVMVIHGESDGTLDYMKMKKPANWILHKPPLPISYGTHHSKAMLLVYAKGIRVIVHTANLIHIDWNNKSQGLWMQDFPWKDQTNSSSNMVCGFETDLIEYLSALKLPEFIAKLPALENCKINSSFFKKFDYSESAVRLVGSVPGYHNGSNLKKWGHMKLRTILQDCVFDKEFRNSPLAYQFSSLGSLDEKWMSEFATSLSSGVTEDKKPLGLGESLIIWPTVEDVRCSIEGYGAGGAIPSPLKNVEKEFLKKYWAKWAAKHSGRCRSMPHIKTFTRYNGQDLAWFLLTSSNLSKAAWGALQKNNSQLMIRSYELGVLFLPTQVKEHGYRFSCTNNGNKALEISKSLESGSEMKKKRRKLVTLAWRGSENMDSNEVIRLPVPYELPPKRYTSQDIPWSWDRRYQTKDVYGQIWPR